MAFNGTEGKQITLQEGSEMTASYRQNNTGEIIGHYMGKDIITNILCQENCVGIRIYYGLNNENKKELVFVGVNADGNDLVQGIIGDRSYPCPTSCSEQNQLNS